MSEVEAVVFDLDGVLLDSEEAWDDARRDLAAEHGREWSATATRDMMGMSSREWPVYVRDTLGVPLTADEINADVVRRVLAGERGPHRDIAVLNAGAAIYVGVDGPTLEESVRAAEAAIDDGRAADVLERLIAFTGSAAGTP